MLQYISSKKRKTSLYKYILLNTPELVRIENDSF